MRFEVAQRSLLSTWRSSTRFQQQGQELWKAQRIWIRQGRQGQGQVSTKRLWQVKGLRQEGQALERKWQEDALVRHSCDWLCRLLWWRLLGQLPGQAHAELGEPACRERQQVRGAGEKKGQHDYVHWLEDSAAMPSRSTATCTGFWPASNHGQNRHQLPCHLLNNLHYDCCSMAI